MSVESAPYYWLVCDEPGCTSRSTEGDDFSAWADESSAIEMAESSDWLILDSKHYCDNHATKHDPDLKEDCDGSSTCDSLSHIEALHGIPSDAASQEQGGLT